MPFPSGYERKFGFEGFQDTHPSTPLPGTQIDVELDGVAKSTAALTAFIQKFARADGRLANASVGVDQLAADFAIGFKAPTMWEPGIMYVLGDTVFEGAGFYTCTEPHTSGSAFEPANWDLIVDFGSQAQAAAASAAAAQAYYNAMAASVLGPTNIIMARNYATPALADAAAVALVGVVYLDTSFTLAANVSLAAKWVGAGGVITTGAYNLTFSKGFSASPNMKCFDSAGSGAISISNAGEIPVGWFGAVGDGSTDDRPAAQRAIATARNSGGGTVLIDRPLLLNRVAGADAFYNGLVIPYNAGVSDASQVAGRVHLRFVGAGALLAGDNSMVMLRMSDSFSTVYNPVITANGKTGIIGRAFIPENISQTTTKVNQNYNRSFGGQIIGCAEGDIYEGGPSPSGADSGCWYNISSGMQMVGCTRNIWMRDSTSSGLGGINRNAYIGGRIGQGSNTGIRIDTGSGNYFLLSYEGINLGTTPSATPTGVYIATTGSGGDNNSNHFGFGNFEAVTRPFDNHNPLTEIDGPTFDAAACNWAAFPCKMVGGDPTQTPLILPGIIRQGNSQLPGVQSNTATLNPGGTIFTSSDNTVIGGAGDGDGLSNIAHTATTGPGGSTLAFNFQRTYVPMAEYHLNAGGYDVGTPITVYGRYLGRICETVSGTFVADETAVNTSTGTPSAFTVAISRTSASNIRVTVTLTKAAMTFILFAGMLRLA